MRFARRDYDRIIVARSGAKLGRKGPQQAPEPERVGSGNKGAAQEFDDFRAARRGNHAQGGSGLGLG